MTRRRRNPPRAVAPTTTARPPLGLRGVAFRSPPGPVTAKAAAFLLFGAFASAAGQRTKTTTTRLALSHAFFVGPKTTTKADRHLLLCPRRRLRSSGPQTGTTRRAWSPEAHLPTFSRRWGGGGGRRPVAASLSSLDAAPPSPPPPSSSSSPSPKSSSDPQSFEGATTTTTPVVVVRRNRQSMSFREGSPLVFPGAISYTYERTDDPDGDDGVEGAAGGGIPTGALVAVAVASAKEGGRGRGGGENRRGGGRGGKKSRGKNGGDSSSSSYPHAIVSSVDGSIVYSSSTSDSRSFFEEDWKDAQVIGYGVYNPKSMYRVRILCHASTHPETFRAVRGALLKKKTKEEAESEALGIILRDKMTRAASVRTALGLPSGPSDTDTYRLINGEGDGLSGLAVDVLGGEVAVVASSASWCEDRKSVVVDALKRALEEHPRYGGEGRTIEIVWRTTASRLAQDGHEYVDGGGGGEGRTEDLTSASSTENDDDGNGRGRRVVAIENGVRYVTHPFSASTQKTGFYCDQRDNRRYFARLCSGKRVLDLCCYHGGFALCAAILGNAERCVGVDSSRDAIETASENALLNDLDERTVRFAREDVATYAKRALEDEGERYDAIVLDPPKLAPSTSSLERASRKYRAINRDAMKLIDPERGGLFLTCTCSAAMTQKDGGRYFLDVIRGAGYAAGRVVTLLSVNGPATCHVRSPASYPAGAYLTAALFHVGPAEERR